MSTYPTNQISLESLSIVLFADRPPSISDEQDVWRAVVCQAWRDAFGRLSGSDTQSETKMTRLRAEARRWFTIETEDRREVLELAGADVARIERMATTLIMAMKDGDAQVLAAYEAQGLVCPRLAAEVLDGVATMQVPHGFETMEEETSREDAGLTPPRAASAGMDRRGLSPRSPRRSPTESTNEPAARTGAARPSLSKGINQ